MSTLLPNPATAHALDTLQAMMNLVVCSCTREQSYVISSLILFPIAASSCKRGEFLAIRAAGTPYGVKAVSRNLSPLP